MATAQYMVGLLGMPPLLALQQAQQQAQQQAAQQDQGGLAAMFGGAAGPAPFVPQVAPPPRLPTQHGTLDGAAPPQRTLWMWIKDWADTKQEEQQEIMAEFQREQMEKWQAQQQQQAKQQLTQEERRYQEQAAKVQRQREKLARAKRQQDTVAKDAAAPAEPAPTA